MQNRPGAHAMFVWILLATISVSGLFAQGKPTASVPPGAETVSPHASDASLEQAIRKRFAASKIGANGFTVKVTNGIATLRGEAAVAQHKGVATRLARLAGAKDVVNQISISDAARQKMRRAQPKKQKVAPERATPRKADVAKPADDEGKSLAANEETGEPSRAESSATVPRFKIIPSARRGEARSERRRY